MSRLEDAKPESFPVGWHAAIRNGGGVIYVENLPWTPCSSAKRFYFLLRALRADPGHPLHAAASHRWSVTHSPAGIVITRVEAKRDRVLPGAQLIAAAMSTEIE